MPVLLITRKPGVRKHTRLIHLQRDECHYLHLPLLSQTKATAILKRIAANSPRTCRFRNSAVISYRGDWVKYCIMVISTACWILSRRTDPCLSGSSAAALYTDEIRSWIHIRMLHGQSISTSTAPDPSIFTRWDWNPQVSFEARG